MASFLDLVNLVLDEIDEDQLTTVSFASEADASIRRVKNYIRMKYRELFFERQDWSWARLHQTLSTVAGVATYTLDAQTDYQRLQSVYLPGEPPVELVPYQEYLRKVQEFQGVITGRPYLATVLNDQLVLFPTPAEAYTVNVIGSKIYTELMAWDHVPALPDNMIHVLFYHATYLAKLHDNEADANVWLAEYMKALQALRNSESNNHKGYAMIPEDETTTAEYYHTELLQ